MIELINVTKTYRMKSGEIKALDEVSLSLPVSGMVFVLGKSGCGKSTLLNILGGLDEITSGEILIDGISMSDYRAKDYDKYRNRYIGFIFQEYNLIDGFNVGKNISLALELQQNKEKHRLIENVLEQVKLEGYYNRKINELSGGQKQRVAIARALVKKPHIILADEPTGNLDSTTAEEIFGLLKELSKDRLILVVSHDRENAEKYADRIIELKDGEVLSDRVINAVRKTQSLLSNVKKDYIICEKSDEQELDEANKENSLEFAVEKQQTKAIDRNEKTDEQNSKLDSLKSNKKQKVSGNMSFMSALSYAFNNLWHKKFRVFASIILFMLSLALFNFSYATSRYNVYDTAYNTFKDEGYSYVSLNGEGDKNNNYILANFGEEATPIYVDNRIQITCGVNNSGEGYYDSHMAYSIPINSDIAMQYELKVLYGRLPEKSTEICVSKYKAENILHNYKDYWDSLGINTIDGLVNNAQDTYGIFTIVGIIDTKFPAKYDELRDKTDDELIQIQDNLTHSFWNQTRATPHVSAFCHEKYYEDFYVPNNLSFSYILGTNMPMPSNQKLNVYPVKALEELDINYHIAPNLSAGVVMTMFAAKEFIIRAGYGNELTNYTYETIVQLLSKYDIRAELSSSQGEYNLNERIIGVFDSEKFSNNMFIGGSALTRMFDKIKCVSAIVIDIDDKDALRRAIDCSILGKGEVELNFNNDAADELISATKYAEQFKLIGGAASGVFAFFVVVLLLNYFMSTIKDKNREIGVLRALGVKNSNVLAIFFLEAAIISVSAFILSVPLGYILTNWLESLVMGSLAMGYNVFVHFIDIGIVSSLVTFALCIGIALIGCIAPFLKLFKCKPMEIIRKQ